MTDPEKEARIRALIDHYRPHLGLHDWIIKPHFFSTRAEMGEEEDQHEAGCSADPEYEQAELDFALDEMIPESMNYTVLHELCHAINWRLYHAAEWLLEHHDGGNAAAKEWLRLELESCTTRMERILMRLIPPLP